jgi:hypothetical protein
VPIANYEKVYAFLKINIFETIIFSNGFPESLFYNESKDKQIKVI